MVTTKLKTAVIGYGHLGKWHCQKAEAFPELSELKYIVEKFPSGIEAAKIAHPNALVVDDISKCIHDIDAAFVVTPTSFHFEIVSYPQSHWLRSYHLWGQYQERSHKFVVARYLQQIVVSAL